MHQIYFYKDDLLQMLNHYNLWYLYHLLLWSN